MKKKVGEKGEILKSCLMMVKACETTFFFGGREIPKNLSQTGEIQWTEVDEKHSS